MSETAVFGTWLQQRRKALDLTQERLAERVSCSLTAIQKIENGTRRPSRQIAERLAECLSVPPERHDAFILFARNGDIHPSSLAFLDPTEEQRTREGSPTDEAPAPRAGKKLPTPLTSIIGRDSLIEQVVQTLKRSDVRLVTLSGPPGVGKTRLAVEVARTWLAHAGGEIYFVSLAAVDDPNFVIPATARAAGLRESGAGSLREALVAGLSQKEALLVLDNMEHLIEAAPEVAGLLEECPVLKILVTSRGRLRVRGERQVELPPLTLPDAKSSLSVEQLAAYPAIELFASRAEEADPGFVLTSDNARTVAGICTRLEGLPLAIELAASRTRLLPPATLLGKLESRLAPLAGGPRDLPARHRTLSAAIAWSYDLLKGEEQTLFARLAVFAGGCTSTAAEAVCNAVGDLPFDLLDGMESLVDVGLLQRRPVGSDREARFSMLESVREFAYDRLRERGEEDAVRRLHAEYCVVLAEAAEPQLAGDDARRWLDLLEAEQDNLRATLAWALDRHEFALATRMCASLWRFWRDRGYLSEGRRWIEQALAKGQEAGVASMAGVSSSVYPTMLKGAGILASNQGEYDDALALFERAMSLFAEIGDEKGIADCLNSMGVAMHYKSAYDRAEQYYERALALRRKLGNRSDIAASLNNLALIANNRQDFDRGVSLMEESLDIHREIGNRRDILYTLYNLGIALELKEPGRAVSLYEECLPLAIDLGDKYLQASCLIKLGQTSLSKNDLEEAEKRIRQGIAISRSISYKALVAYGLIYLGHMQLRHGDYGAAEASLHEAIVMCNELSDTGKVALCLDEAAAWVALQNSPGWAERAVTLYSASTASGEFNRPYTREFHDAIVASARNLLGEELFQSAWDQGQCLTLKAAVEMALALLAGPENPAPNRHRLLAQQQVQLRSVPRNMAHGIEE